MVFGGCVEDELNRSAREFVARMARRLQRSGSVSSCSGTSDDDGPYDCSMRYRGAGDHFYSINEHRVDDISLAFFYKPHTITLLTTSILGLLYSALTR